MSTNDEEYNQLLSNETHQTIQITTLPQTASNDSLHNSTEQNEKELIKYYYFRNGTNFETMKLLKTVQLLRPPNCVETCIKY